jgi:putative glutamine amidotransferase
MSRPRIGITTGLRPHVSDHGDTWEELYLDSDYFDAVEAAGCLPLALPPVRGGDTLRELLRCVEGVVISGGPDTPPSRYAQAAHPRTVPVHPRRDEFDFQALSLALEMGLPVLAICYGAQLLNVHFGGTLVQDIPSLRPTEEVHQRARPRPMHGVRVKPGSKLARILGRTELETNSSHHQCVDRLGAGLCATAWSPAGIIEAVETEDARFVIGVQWHPEELADRAEHLALFAALGRVAREGKF